jgi:hypothetical protein
VLSAQISCPLRSLALCHGAQEKLNLIILKINKEDTVVGVCSPTLE